MKRAALGCIGIWVASTVFGAGCDAILHVPNATLVQHLSCVDGVCSCEAPYTYCTAELEGSCPIDLQTDAKNCGKCGHDCLGGTCAAGACQPFVLDGTTQPDGLSLYDDKLFFGVCIDPSSTVAFDTLPLTGGTVTPAIMGPECGSVQQVFGDTMYWAGFTNIYATALEPIAPHPTQLATSNAWILAPNATNLYWGAVDSSGNDLGVYAMTLPSGLPTHIYTGPTQGIAANSTGVFWVTATDGVHFQANGATTNTIINSTPAGGLFVDEQHAFFSTPNGLEVMPPSGGKATLLAASANLVVGTVEGDQFFWLDEGLNTVNQVPIAGGATKVLGKNYSFCNTAAIAADATAVYWLAGPLVWKVAR